MPVYVWRGKNSLGEKRKGEVDAPDEAAALAQVRRLRIGDPVIKEKPKDLLAGIAFLQPKVTGKDVVVFTRQLSTMIDAGLPLVQALQILEKQQTNVTFKKILNSIRADVEAGSTLADSMRKNPKVFDNFFTNMIEAGETGGILDIILSRLAAFMEKAMALGRKIRGAMIYPAICLLLSIVMLAVILIYVIPVFAEMFASFGKALPVPTQFVIDMSDFVKAYLLHSVIAVIVFVYACRKFYNTGKGRLAVDRVLLTLPLIGELLRKVAVAKFTRTLGTMLHSGVPILAALQIVARTAGNKVIEGAVHRVAEAIAEGRPMAEPLEESGVFPNMVVQMIGVGESVGALDTMLDKIADFYDQEVDQAVANVTAAIEPLMLVVLGGLIGGLVIAMYLPIFQIASLV